VREVSRPVASRPGMSARTIEELDALSADEALANLAPLFEGAPRFLARLTAQRPFETWDELFARAMAIALSMPEAEQIELIDAHPRLGAPPANVSRMSFVEQGYETDTGLAADELGRLNDAYEARFGFRYCVFVAGRPRSELVPELVARLEADKEAERRRALRDVVAIAMDRQRKFTEGSR